MTAINIHSARYDRRVPPYFVALLLKARKAKQQQVKPDDPTQNLRNSQGHSPRKFA